MSWLAADREAMLWPGVPEMPDFTQVLDQGSGRGRDPELRFGRRYRSWEKWVDRPVELREARGGASHVGVS